MTWRFLISGKVQGVFYRASTREQAQREGIDGWASNLADGRVEVIAASADAAALQRFEAWLHQGPPAARVTGVQRDAVDAAVSAGFRVR